MGELLSEEIIRLASQEAEAEHDEMAALLTSLCRYFSLPDPGREAEVILGRLIDYSQEHFEREEALMDLCPDYLGAVEHRDAHTAFLERLLKLAQLLRISGDLSADMPVMVEQWWRRHVDGTDQELMRHLQRQFAATRMAAE